MGRTKQYDRTELLDQAIELFRAQGYNGTSTAELVAELGVNRKSMYAEFGSKHGLFEAALERYDAHHLTRVLARLESPQARLDDIAAAFQSYADASEGPFQGLGCLMCNTAAERGALDPSIGKFVDGYFDRISSAFRSTLDHAQATGDLSPTTDVEEMTSFLTTTFIGVTASIRAQAPPAQLHATVRTVASVVDHNRT